MAYGGSSTSDIEKLQNVVAELTKTFGSIESVLEAFGLSDMPVAQQYGILFGCLTFVLTVSSVLGLLILGGTFKRIKEQAETGQVTVMTPIDSRRQRALLLEELLESRDRMLEKYNETTTEDVTPLTKMLINVAPKSAKGLPELVDEKAKEAKLEEIRKSIPKHYEENYIKSYQTCQERPGGSLLSGRPEARFEAYARAYAGCGAFVTTAYRRSYARLYEATACQNHKTDDKYGDLFLNRPHDVVGRLVRLEALEVDRHLDALFLLTSGQASLEHKAFHPDEVWGFQEDGPFSDAQAMRRSFVFQHKINEAAFAIVENLSDRLLGAILLTHDDPRNLSIQLECPMMQPLRDGSKEQLEACFLLMDRLFANGYRRLQFSIDVQDANNRKLANRLGFSDEGVLYKHLVVKEASRDSNVFGLLNSDWKKGARAAMFKKLYGAPALKADLANEKREQEAEEKALALQKKKEMEEAEKDDGNKKL